MVKFIHISFIVRIFIRFVMKHLMGFTHYVIEQSNTLFIKTYKKDGNDQLVHDKIFITKPFFVRCLFEQTQELKPVKVLASCTIPLFLTFRMKQSVGNSLRTSRIFLFIKRESIRPSFSTNNMSISPYNYGRSLRPFIKSDIFDE